jgi:uncharacterized protein involved in cysteine biosynthesis
MSDVNRSSPKRVLEQEQSEILQQLEDWLEIPMLLLSFVWLALFGYVTAALATFFMGRDAENPEAEVAGVKEVTALQAEIAAPARGSTPAPRSYLLCLLFKLV